MNYLGILVLSAANSGARNDDVSNINKGRPVPSIQLDGPTYRKLAFPPTKEGGEGKKPASLDFGTRKK